MITRPDGPAGRRGPPPESRHREHRNYFIVMGICIGLIVIAWTIVRLFSTPAAIGMSVVAMVLPPVAAIVGNAGH